MTLRRLRPADQLLTAIGRRLAGDHGAPSARAYPARHTPDSALSAPERRRAAALMRVNHAGEIAAQGLYHGQALTARSPDVVDHLRAAAVEERDHMRWCEQRLAELGEGPSRLAPLWFAGSFAMGAAAGLAGDRWNLGFVAETEQQVSDHLASHLKRLPPGDTRSRDIVRAMQADEERHGAEAKAAGGAALPTPVQRLMRRIAKVMTFGAYHL